MISLYFHFFNKLHFFFFTIFFLKKKAYTKWINWIIRENKIKITNFEKDLKDGIVLCIIATKLTGKNIKFHTNFKLKQLQRENFQFAFETLKKNGFQKETQGISAEDFEKDEEGNTDKVDYTQVLGFFWQLVKKFFFIFPKFLKNLILFFKDDELQKRTL